LISIVFLDRDPVEALSGFVSFDLNYTFLNLHFAEAKSTVGWVLKTQTQPTNKR